MIESGHSVAETVLVGREEIGGYVRQHRFIFGGEHSDSIRQIQFAMLIVRFYLGQRRPEFLQREAVDAGIDFVELALLVGKLRFLDDGGDSRFGFAHHAAVARWIGQHGRKNRGRSISAAMRRNERFQGLRAHKGSVAREHNSKFCTAQRTLGDVYLFTRELEAAYRAMGRTYCRTPLE